MSTREPASYSFACLNCHTRAFLIRGLCATCAPELHQADKQCMEFMNRAEEAFTAKTGKKALSAWYEFETFLEEYMAAEAVEVFNQREETAARLSRPQIGE